MSGLRAVDAVVFDLDDTLYPQSSFLEGALGAVAQAGASAGLDPDHFRAALLAAVAAGSDRGDTIDRALALCGASDVEVAPLVDAFRSYRPVALSCYPGVAEALGRLEAVVPLGVLTDGDPPGQRAKLAATGLASRFAAVVVTDELGRERRKPAPEGLVVLADALGVAPDRLVVVGDRPDKDVAVAAAVGARAIRVRTGEHASRPDHPGTWRTAESAVEAVDLLLAELSVTPGGRR